MAKSENAYELCVTLGILNELLPCGQRYDGFKLAVLLEMHLYLCDIRLISQIFAV